MYHYIKCGLFEQLDQSTIVKFYSSTDSGPPGISQVNSFLFATELFVIKWIYNFQFQTWNVLDSQIMITILHLMYTIGWSEFRFFWKLQKALAVSGPRHSADFITSDGIVIG